MDERAAVLARGYGVPLSNVRGHAEREVQTEWPMPDTWPWLVSAPGRAGSSPGWNPPAESGVKACPFLFIYAGDGARCTDGDGDPTQPGMSWMGKQVEPTPNQAEVKHEQHVIELATEAALASHESLEGLYASSVKLDVITTTIEPHASSIETLEPHHHVRDARQQPPRSRSPRSRCRRLDRHPPLPLLLPRRQQEGVRAVGRGRAAPQHDPDQVRHPDGRRHRQGREVRRRERLPCLPDDPRR